MARPKGSKKIGELLLSISLSPTGRLRSGLVGRHPWRKASIDGTICQGAYGFSERTLDRLLQSLMKKGLVERIEEPRTGKKGRPSGRYRLTEKGWGLLNVSYVSAKWVGNVPFFGYTRHVPDSPSGRTRYEYVRLGPEEKARYEKQKIWMKDHPQA